MAADLQAVGAEQVDGRDGFTGFRVRHAQVELGRRPVEVQPRPGQAFEVAVPGLRVHHVEEHVEQRLTAAVRPGREFADQHLEGHVLVRKGLQGDGAHARKHREEVRVAVQIGPEHKGVHKGADEVFRGEVVAVGEGVARFRAGDRVVGGLRTGGFAEEAVAAYRRDKGLAGSPEGAISTQTLSELNSRYTAARGRRIEKEGRLVALSKASLNPGELANIPEVSGNATLSALRIQDVELSRKSAELASQLGDSHPKLIQVRNELNAVRARFIVETQRITLAVRAELDAATSEEEELKELVDGVDELGVLLYGHDKNAYWYGSRLSLEETREIAPYQNATGLQVTSAVLAGMVWAVENPKAGIVEADEIDYKRCLEVQSPYLGPVEGHYTDWTPLDGRPGLFPEDLDEKDPWQFRNILVR